MCACGGKGNGGDDGGEPDKYETVYFGVNLSGGELAAVYPGVDGTHYGYPGEKDLDYFKSKGFKMIRFPFRWERIQNEMNGPLLAGELAKMKAFVQAAQDRDMLILLDMHNFGRYCYYSNGVNSDDNQYAIIGSSLCKVEHFCDVWKKLAAEFKDYTCIWAYDIMNEPSEMLSNPPWKKIAQACIDAIREVDTKPTIMISGDEFSSASRWPTVSGDLKELVDPHRELIFQAHTYFDRHAGGTYENSYDGEQATPQTGVARLEPFVNWLKANNLRGFVGEYGIPDDDPRWNTTLDNALKYLQENGINGTYWSAGPRWGDYKLAVQPTNNYQTDRPQMEVLVKYKTAQAKVK